MISGLNASGLQFVNSVNDLQSRLSQVQAELSSGLKVQTPADAPDQVSDILQLHATIQQNQDIQTNLTSVKAEATTADSALSNGITMLDQVQTLAAQGLALNTTASTRQTLASQVQDLMQQMVSLSQTQVDGRYIFSGDADQSPTYQFDANSPTGVDRLQVVSSTPQATDASGNKFPVALTATQIFDARNSSDQPTDGNVFAAMNAVRVALQNNDTTALQAATASVKDASSYMNQQESFYGTVENRVSAALDDASTMSVTYQQDLSNRQDADATSAIVEMQQYLTNLQAAMASEAKMPQTSLFSLLGS
jgi:flagellar hook-associated protein 3 FlgL